MKQTNLFSDEYEDKQDNQYSSKIKTPEYKPNNEKPNILELLDESKTKRIINRINVSNIGEEEKRFLIESAKRHNVFNYQKIADYYSHATKEVQELMEQQALVIIDFKKAFQHGYIKLAHDVANKYFDNYEE